MPLRLAQGSEAWRVLRTADGSAAAQLVVDLHVARHCEVDDRVVAVAIQAQDHITVLQGRTEPAVSEQGKAQSYSECGSSSTHDL